jgi:dihydroorotase-like cyclic amidohydrolase
LDQIVEKMVTNPRRIFGLPEQAETWIEVDFEAEYEIRAADQFTRCGWTPFEGRKVRGRVRQVMLRGREAYRDGKVLGEPGHGRNVRGRD